MPSTPAPNSVAMAAMTPITAPRRKMLNFLIVAVLASMFGAGCLMSKEAYLHVSPEYAVPDFSGIYQSGETGGQRTITRERDNLFTVRFDDEAEPYQAVVVPLELPGTFLLQLYDGDEYTLAALLVEEDTLRVAMFSAAAQGVMSAALGDEDRFRKLAADVQAQRLAALYAKHGLEVDEDLLLTNRPDTEALIAFFNDCLKEHGVLEDGEVLTRMGER